MTWHDSATCSQEQLGATACSTALKPLEAFTKYTSTSLKQRVSHEDECKKNVRHSLISCAITTCVMLVSIFVIRDLFCPSKHKTRTSLQS